MEAYALSSLALLSTAFFLLLPPSLGTNDTDALAQFRSQTDAHGVLAASWTGGDACAAGWVGVRCIRGRVSALSLPTSGLRGGPLDPLSRLDQLRILDLHGNRLDGKILPVINCSNLRLLYLAGNDFSGSIPPEIGSLRRLRRLDLSDNNLDGHIPRALGNMTSLLTLRLQDNALTGEIPDFPASLLQLNVSNNQLLGRVPDSLKRRFGNQSFVGNQGLCGWTPFPAVCDYTDAPPPAETTVPSNITSLPTATYKDGKQSQKGLSSGALVAIVVGNSVLFLALVSFGIAYCCGRHYPKEGSHNSKVGNEEGKRRSGSSYNSDKKVYDSDATTTEGNRLVFYDRKCRFELEDLLRASAEMLGKGILGTVYRAVLDDGCTVVAVKRLKDANPCGRREFEQYMDLIGELRHSNIVPLRAYYYAKEEKLLVYDYLPNGSLHSLIHGNRGPGRIPVDWTTRLSLVLGAARGLARIHEEYSEPKIPHGNVKSSNILLDKNGGACVSDFGLSLLLNPVHATARLGGYRAPEQAEIKRLSQKGDVYSFGIVLLEVLTGRAPLPPQATLAAGAGGRGGGGGKKEEAAEDLPKWVQSMVRDEWTAEVFDQELLRYKNIEEELVAMLQVGLACVVPQPERRPTMTEVAKRIEEIRVEQSPLTEEDCDYSRNSPSLSNATTEDGLPGY